MAERKTRAQLEKQVARLKKQVANLKRDKGIYFEAYDNAEIELEKLSDAYEETKGELDELKERIRQARVRFTITHISEATGKFSLN